MTETNHQGDKPWLAFGAIVAVVVLVAIEAFTGTDVGLVPYGVLALLGGVDPKVVDYVTKRSASK